MWHTVFCVIQCPFRWVRWDPKWPWASWQWVGMTFQAFRGVSGAQIAFTILLATSIGNTVTQCAAHERGGHPMGLTNITPILLFKKSNWTLSNKYTIYSQQNSPPRYQDSNSKEKILLVYLAKLCHWCATLSWEGFDISYLVSTWFLAFKWNVFKHFCETQNNEKIRNLQKEVSGSQVQVHPLPEVSGTRTRRTKLNIDCVQCSVIPTPIRINETFKGVCICLHWSEILDGQDWTLLLTGRLLSQS